MLKQVQHDSVMKKTSIKNKRKNQVHISRLFPNFVTLMGLCAGLSALRFALGEKWELAVGFIVIASLIDAVDGRLARILNSTSEFGAQLDSLSDFFNFGVAPPLILYLWATHDVKGWGWALVLFFTICCAIRLARFNISHADEDDNWSERFFVGMPAPAGALLALSPMALYFEFGESFKNLFLFSNYDIFPIFTIIFGALIGTAMASRMPTYSLKKVTVKPKNAYLIMLTVGALAISVIIEPWLTLSFIGLIYAISLPISIIHHYNLSK